MLVVGGRDTGKTTFSRRLVQRTLEAGISTALLDADPGQANIGPTFCLGLALPAGVDADLVPAATAFVGGTSPLHFMPEHLSAIRRMADLARDRDTIVIDMPGTIRGSAARRLYQLTTELLSPDHIVALCRDTELNSILAPMELRASVHVHHVHVSAVVVPRPAEYRVQRRALTLAAYFRDSEVHTVSLDAVALCGTWLGGGAPIAPHLFKYLAVALADYTRLFYAEQYGNHLGLMVSKTVPEDCPALGIALEQFGASEVTVSRAPLLKNLVVGLETDGGKLLGLGRIVSIDFKRRQIGIVTPVRTPSATQVIKFGGVRIGEDGSQRGIVLPGEL